MTFLWLLVWLFCGTPQVERWNAWLVGLAVCAFLDIYGVRKELRP